MNRPELREDLVTLLWQTLRDDSTVGETADRILELIDAAAAPSGELREALLDLLDTADAVLHVLEMEAASGRAAEIAPGTTNSGGDDEEAGTAGDRCAGPVRGPAGG